MWGRVALDDANDAAADRDEAAAGRLAAGAELTRHAALDNAATRHISLSFSGMRVPVAGMWSRCTSALC